MIISEMLSVILNLLSFTIESTAKFDMLAVARNPMSYSLQRNSWTDSWAGRGNGLLMKISQELLVQCTWPDRLRMGTATVLHVLTGSFHLTKRHTASVASGIFNSSVVPQSACKEWVSDEEDKKMEHAWWATLTRCDATQAATIMNMVFWFLRICLFALPWIHLLCLFVSLICA